MTVDDRSRWNERYRAVADASSGSAPDPAVRELLLRAEPWLPRRGRALELACGAGREAVWLARRGLDVLGVDIAEEALALAAARAERGGVAARLTLLAADLDDGLPAACTGAYDVIVACHFRSPVLEEAVRAHLGPGGVLVASRLSVVGRRAGEAGPEVAFLAEPGELAGIARRSGLRIHHDEEADGAAGLVAQRP